MCNKFETEIIDCENKSYVMIVEKNAQDLNNFYYLINHENFMIRKSYCDMLVDKLNEQNEKIRKLKGENDSLEKFLNIRNFIE